MEGVDGAARVPAAAPIERFRVALYGAVQGVGFRPFVYRLASGMGLRGTVSNSAAGVVIEVEGARAELDEFLARLEGEKPRAAVVLASETALLPPVGFSRFEILPSNGDLRRTAAVLPDLATCPDCLRELFDGADRRYRYPFINCTACGPRYSIILDIPYDRPRTTMRAFALCPECGREYTDPSDRRFHAQPNACPKCGPRLTPAVAEAARAIGAGCIVALKGIGGFQLLADARNEAAIARLRRLKRREEKPLALMMRSLEAVSEYCAVSAEEARVLASPAAPIVLLKPRSGALLAPNVAHNSPYLGVMLPYSPLHHLLLGECAGPVVATSGNLSDEPIAIDNDEARARLGGIADLFLVHDRPVARPVDDSVVRVVRRRESVIRRARGYAPLPVPVRRALPAVLAAGGHLKSTVAIAVGRQVFLSQHIGDLDTLEARRAFANAVDDLCRLYRFRPELVACDLHPDYASTRWALASGLPVVRIQHHHAHAAACAAENDVREPYLAAVWDGAGYGADGTVWGGEFFLADGARLERVAHLRPFRLPGGEKAMREGWRSAAGLLWECERDACLAALAAGGRARLPIARMLEHGVNCPATSSAGRLFDAVASLAGVAQENRFEGHAAMLLERAIDAGEGGAYPLPGGDWGPLAAALLADLRRGAGAGVIAARFHNALAAWILEVAQAAGVRDVLFSGGVFQNGYLTERAAALLEKRGFRVWTHQRIPANDGGIALGQAVLAAAGS